MARFPLLPILATIVVLLALSGCSQKECPVECASGPLTPLCVGDSWVYAVSRYGSDLPSWSRADTIRITGLQELGGEEYYLTNHCFAFRQTSEGLSFACHDGSAFALEIFLRTPTADREHYGYLSLLAPRQFKVSVTMSTEAVVTPSGTYPAFVYGAYLTHDEIIVWFAFAPGVGLVKMVDTGGDLWLLSSAHLVAEPRGSSRDEGGRLCDP
jgi:hypothetical protein